MSRRVTAALVDLSGTIHVDDVAIKGAKEALNKYALSLITNELEYTS